MKSIALLLLASITLVSVQDEIAIGREAQAQVRRKTPQVTDDAVRTYVSRVGQALAARANAARYPYSFSIANYREINAFALPGGPVWVNRGAIQAAQNESQLAAVLAHEVAHVARRHSAEQLSNVMVTNLGLSLLGALLGSSAGATAAKIAATYLASGAFLKFSRDDEREADTVGVEIMSRAGWDPHGMIELMETIRQQQQHDPSSVEVFFSNHPSPRDRLTVLQRIVPRARRGRSDTPEFQAIRRRLASLPPAKAMPR